MLTQTRFGGSETLPDEKAKRDPWLTRMFAGYAFAIDYRDRRGHAYMLQDQEQTKRVTERPQPGACLHCHASIIPTYRRLGGGDVFKGFEALGKLTYAEAHAEVVKTGSSNPVAGGTTATFAARRRRASGELRGLPRSEEHGTARDAARRSSAASRRWPPGTAPTPAPREHRALAARRAEPRPTIPTSTPRGRRCGPSSAASATSSTTAAPRRRCSIPWNNGLKVEQIESVLRRVQVPRRPPLLRLDARRDRRRGAQGPASRVRDCGARASTRAAASPAPTATCPTCARAR